MKSPFIIDLELDRESVKAWKEHLREMDKVNLEVQSFLKRYDNRFLALLINNAQKILRERENDKSIQSLDQRSL